MRKPVLLLPLVILVGTTTGNSVAGSTIHRCFGTDDVPVFTDRNCESIGAHEYSAPSPMEPRVDDCSREIEDLKYSVQTALAANDVNQLTGLYHWTGASTHMVGTLMPDLESLAQRSLADIGVELDDHDGVERPARLWLDLFDPARPGETIRTRFGLVMKMGCWWLHHE